MMRSVGPVAVVVLRQTLLAAVAGSCAVDVHDRDDCAFRFFPQGSRPRIVAGQPLGQAAADPTAARFPSVLAGLNPDRRPALVWYVARHKPQGRAGAAAVALAQFKSFAAATLFRQRFNQ